MFACTNTCFCAQTPANLSKNRSNVVQNRSKSLKITRKLFETARNCLKWLKDRSQPPPPPPPPLPTVSTVYEQCTNTSIPVSTPSVLTPPLVSQHLPLFQDLCTNVNPAALSAPRAQRASPLRLPPAPRVETPPLPPRRCVWCACAAWGVSCVSVQPHFLK